MIEKVNPAHPDKIADRIAGAIVDIAYSQNENPKVAAEILIGHGLCHAVVETTEDLDTHEIESAIHRIAGNIKSLIVVVSQDEHLTDNQRGKIRCGDNGIFKGVPLTEEQKEMSRIAREIYSKYPYDGKYILDQTRLIICQSNANTDELKDIYPTAEINPLGYWTGGTDVDTGATNRKLGSDMADSVTGGGLCLSGDTEFIGEDLKWHRFDEYTGGKVGQWNNGKLEFVEPIKYIHNKNDSFLYFYNDTKLSMKLTPYHQILIKTSKGNLIKKSAYEVAEKLDSPSCNSGSILHNFTYKNEIVNQYQDEDDLRLQIAFCADGTIVNNNFSWNGRIRVKKEYKKERLRYLLRNKIYNETKDGAYSIFWINAPYVSKSLYECCKNQDLFIVYDELFKWDGDENRKLYRTTKKEDADFAQFVIQSQGRTAGICVDNRVGKVKHNGYVCKSVLYTVKEYKSNITSLRKGNKGEVKIEKVYDKEDSYCFEVPSHNLIVRHNDRIFITGNCGKDLSKADVSVNIYAFVGISELNLVCLKH